MSDALAWARAMARAMTIPHAFKVGDKVKLYLRGGFGRHNIISIMLLEPHSNMTIQ
jgi:hypothetical protein